MRFRRLVSLHTRTSLLADIYATAGYTSSRASQALLQSLLGRSPSPLTDLGSLHRTCVWENITLKFVLSAQGIDTSTHTHDLFSSLLSSSATPVAQDQQPATTPGTAAPSSSTPNNPTAAAPAAAAANGSSSGEPSTSTSSPPARKEDRPKDKNAKAVKHVVHQIQSSLTPFFQCTIIHIVFIRPLIYVSSQRPCAFSMLKHGAALATLRRSRKLRMPRRRLLSFSTSTWSRFLAVSQSKG